MNATQGFAVQIIHRTEPVREKTSIEEIGDLIDEIRLNGKPRTGGLFF